jgi:hypothetical protein
MKFLYKIPGSYSYVDYNDSKKNDYIYYVVFESIQFLNRERKGTYEISGSICVGTPLSFFRSSKMRYDNSTNKIPEGDTIEIIKKENVEFKNDSFSTKNFTIDKLYDLEIDSLTIFRPEKFKFPKKENREYKLGEILKTDIN